MIMYIYMYTHTLINGGKEGSDKASLGNNSWSCYLQRCQLSSVGKREGRGCQMHVQSTGGYPHMAGEGCQRAGTRYPAHMNEDNGNIYYTNQMILVCIRTLPPHLTLKTQASRVRLRTLFPGEMWYNHDENHGSRDRSSFNLNVIIYDGWKTQRSYRISLGLFFSTCKI